MYADLFVCPIALIAFWHHCPQPKQNQNKQYLPLLITSALFHFHNTQKKGETQ